MTFPSPIERWRPTVQTQLAKLLTEFPVRKSLLDELQLTFERVADILLAIIQKESYGDPDATGDNGNSLGLMQLNYGAGTPQTQGYTGQAAGLLDPTTNVYYGTKYFLWQVNRYRNTSTSTDEIIEKALSAYNAGSSILNNIETYVMKVLEFAGEKKTSSQPASSSSAATYSGVLTNAQGRRLKITIEPLV